MIDTKTLTCSNCHGGDFIRLDNNEFKCTHCGSITIVQDDVAERLEQILRKMQASAVRPAAPSATASRAGAWIIVAVVLVMLTLFIVNIGTNRSTPSTSFSNPSFSLHERPAVDPGLLKIQDLHRASNGEKLVGMVRNDSDRVVTDVSLTVNVHQGPVRKDDRSTSMSQRLLPGESLPIIFDGWSPQKDESFEIASKEVRTDDDFNGRAQLQLKHEQLIRERDRLRFIGQLTNADALPAKSINISINLLDGNGRLIGSGHGSPESSELARGEITNFDVSIDRYDDSDVASMQYVIDSERVKSGAGQ